MDDRKNILLGTSLPKPARPSVHARISAGAALLTLLAIFLARFWAPLAYLHLAFPVAIIAGHLALRRMNNEPGRWTGRSTALFGLYVGYFNLTMIAVLAYLMMRGAS